MRNEDVIVDIGEPAPASGNSDTHHASNSAAPEASALLPEPPHALPPEVKKAMLAAAYAQQMLDRLASLQNEEVIRYTGISRVELGLRLWNAPIGEVASRLGIKKHVLKRICSLFEIPTPPKGYFNTGFMHRSIRWTRATLT